MELKRSTSKKTRTLAVFHVRVFVVMNIRRNYPVLFTYFIDGIMNQIFLYFSVDYNRVILEPEEGVPDSDYINASYVDVSKSI